MVVDRRILYQDEPLAPGRHVDRRADELARGCLRDHPIVRPSHSQDPRPSRDRRWIHRGDASGVAQDDPPRVGGEDGPRPRQPLAPRRSRVVGRRVGAVSRPCHRHPVAPGPPSEPTLAFPRPTTSSLPRASVERDSAYGSATRSGKSVGRSRTGRASARHRPAAGPKRRSCFERTARSPSAHTPRPRRSPARRHPARAIAGGQLVRSVEWQPATRNPRFTAPGAKEVRARVAVRAVGDVPEPVGRLEPVARLGGPTAPALACVRGTGIPWKVPGVCAPQDGIRFFLQLVGLACSARWRLGPWRDKEAS